MNVQNRACMTPEQCRALADALEGVELALPSNTGAHVIVARDFLRAAAGKFDRLRTVIENAPHAWDCTDPDGGSFCTCWKADAL